jgi:hypothetical protein
MNKQRPLSFWQIWNMSSGFLGIQFGWGLQMADMSAICQFLAGDAMKAALAGGISMAIASLAVLIAGEDSEARGSAEV